MKKVLSILMSVIVIMTASVAFAGGIEQLSVRGVNFSNGSEDIYLIEQGSIAGEIIVENTSSENITANLYLAAYAGNKLLSVSVKEVNLVPGIGTYQSNAVTSTEETTEIKAFLWNSTLNSAGTAYVLNDISCDASIKSCTLTVSGVEYDADINTDKNTASYTVNCTVTGTANKCTNEAPVIAVADDAIVETKDDSILTTGKSYKVTAANGNTAIYDFKAYNSQLGWDEKFTGSVISDETTTGINGADYANFAPTYGTWNNGEYRSNGWGEWRNRSSNAGLVLSINNEQASATNTYLSMALGNSSSDQTYYTVRNPLPSAGIPNCKRAVFSFDFRGTDLKEGTYGWLGNFITGFVIAGDGKDTVTVMNRINGADSKPITVATVPMNEWHNLKIIAENKGGTNFSVEYYIDGEFCYEHDQSRKYTYMGSTNTNGLINLEAAFRWFMMGGTTGTVDYDNFCVLFERA